MEKGWKVWLSILTKSIKTKLAVEKLWVKSIVNSMVCRPRSAKTNILAAKRVVASSEVRKRPDSISSVVMLSIDLDFLSWIFSSNRVPDSEELGVPGIVAFRGTQCGYVLK